MIRTTADNSHSRLLHLLQIGAFAFIILWGIRASSEVLGPLLLSVMLAYAVVPFPVWLMKRFRLPKSKATVVTAAVLAGASLMVAFCLEFGIARLMTRMPLYEQNLAGLHEQVAAFLSAHGIDSASLSLKQYSRPNALAP